MTKRDALGKHKAAKRSLKNRDAPEKGLPLH